MIRESSHGFFRGENCPVTNEEGRFVMSDREGESLGRIMAGVLRHFPEKFGLEMDFNGWVDMNAFCESVKKKRRQMHWLRPRHLRAITTIDEKGRYETKGDMVRATYAHSVDIELDLPTDDIPDILYYPCNDDAVSILERDGILPGDRRHVHLSRTLEGSWEAGRVREDVPRIFEVDSVRAIADGYTFWRAGVRVVLVEQVPPEYLSIIDGNNEGIQSLIAAEEE